jgi:hypothetical protein
MWRGCLDIRNEERGVRGVTSYQGKQGGGLFVCGGTRPSVRGAVLLTHGAGQIGSDVANRVQLIASAVDALVETITFQGVMFGNRATTELMLGCFMRLAANGTDKSVLRTTAALHRVAEGPASCALLYQGERLELRDADLTTKHENGGLQKPGGGDPIRVEEGKSDGPVSSIRRYIGLKPLGVQKQGQARAKDILS